MEMIGLIKRLPIDLGQGWYRHTTKAKRIAFGLAGYGNGKPALDLGSGDGFWSRQLRARGWVVTATNWQDTRSSNDTLEVNAEMPLPFPDAAFDLVWAIEVIEHVRHIEQLVSELRRVVRPGGRIILTTPNSAFWLYRLLAGFGITPAQIQNPDHKQFFSLQDIRRLFPTADLYGFFPYALVKRVIRGNIGVLSPTFIIQEERVPVPVSLSVPAEMRESAVRVAR